MKTGQPQQSRLSNWVSVSLKLGVLFSLALVTIGLVLMGMAGTKENEPAAPLSQLPQGIANLNPTAIITLGILALLLTPIVQVVVAGVSFSTARDKLHVGICVALLCMLAFSFALALL